MVAIIIDNVKNTTKLLDKVTQMIYILNNHKMLSLIFILMILSVHHLLRVESDDFLFQVSFYR